MIGEWWIGKDFKESCSDLIEVLFNNLLEGTKEGREKVRIESVLAEIRTEQLQYTTRKRSARPSCSVLRLEYFW
jgi:hypothetical protein